MNKYICIDREANSTLGLSICSQNSIPSAYLPERSQFFILTQTNRIRNVFGTHCWSHIASLDDDKNLTEVTLNIIPSITNDESICGYFKYNNVRCPLLFKL